jgi:hypothetical protein
MYKRNFSLDRLYKLIRNLIILISALSFIASAVTFYISISSKHKVQEIDKKIEFPRQYKHKVFLSMDDFLNFVSPDYNRYDPCNRFIKDSSFGGRPELEIPLTQGEVKQKAKCQETKEKDQRIREELLKVSKMPNKGFLGPSTLKSERNNLRNKSKEFSIFALQLLIIAITVQVTFWGIVLLYRYLFPLRNTGDK